MGALKQDKFNFFIPLEIEKSGEDGKLVKISGVASTDAKDSDGETLIPAGFDFAPLLQSGFLNWNHQARTTSKAICGEPTAAKIINNGKDFFIEGVIYPNEEGKNVVQLAETLEKHSPSRRLGFSIEGQAIERDILNPKRVTKARITGVAITQSPKNPNTLMSIVKGEYDNEFIEDFIELSQIEKASDDRTTITVICSPSAAVRLQKVLGDYKDVWEGNDTIFSIDSKQELEKSVESEVEEKTENQDKQMDKAMMVNTDINPESVEGTNHGKKLFSDLKKSEIYNQIYNRYTTDFEKAEQIYNFINQVKEKSMKTDNITPDVLEKAFGMLDQSILSKAKEEGDDDSSEKEEKEEVEKSDEGEKEEKEEKIEKSEDGGDDDGDDDEDFEKAMNCEKIAKSFFDEGKTKDEVVKAMTGIGITLSLAETSCSNCIAQANAEKDGGKMTVLSKGENDDLSKSNEQIIDKFAGLIDQKFGALGTILKSQSDEIGNLKNQVANLSAIPQGRRSITTHAAVERFEKSADGQNIEVFDSRNVGDMKQLTNRLFGEVELLKSQGKDDATLEKAVADLEISKSTNFAAISPRLAAMNIKVV